MGEPTDALGLSELVTVQERDTRKSNRFVLDSAAGRKTDQQMPTLTG
jgi:hypothetical protein